MKTLLIMWLLMLMIHRQDCADDDGSKPKNVIRIVKIRVHGQRPYMNASVKTHEDGDHFDIYIKLNRPLGSYYLIMNMNLRGKIVATKNFITLLELKRIDFCEFLTEFKANVMMRYFFKKVMVFSDSIVCPFQIGDYNVLNISVTDNLYPKSLLKGVYKFYVEIVEPNGESPKLFAMQVTTEVT